MMKNDKNTSNVHTYPSDSQMGYFIKGSSSYKSTKDNYSERKPNVIDDEYYKKSVLKKKVIAHVSE